MFVDIQNAYGNRSKRRNLRAVRDVDTRPIGARHVPIDVHIDPLFALSGIVAGTLPLADFRVCFVCLENFCIIPRSLLLLPSDIRDSFAEEYKEIE